MIEFFAYSKKEGLRNFQDIRFLPDLFKNEEETLWVDFEAPTETESEILSTLFNFHPLAIEDCIAESHLPKLDDYGDYLFLVVHGARKSDTADSFETVEVNCFIGKRFLVTYHQDFVRNIDQMKKRTEKNTVSLGKGADFFLYEIMDSLVDHYFPILDDFDEAIDKLEREAFENPTRATLDHIFTIKRAVTSLRRIIGPQREIFVRLSRDRFSVISRITAPYFRNVYDHLFKIGETAETFKDQSAGLMEAYLMIVSNRLNEVIKVLTLLATIMLPLTVITGIFGMNFVNMPELKWQYGYYSVLGMMGLVVFGLLFYFKKRKWI